MSEVLRSNGIAVTRGFCALFIVTIFCGMSLLPMVDANSPRQVDIDVSTVPNGISDQFSVEVPTGEIITDFEFEMFEQSRPIDDVVTIDDKADWMNGDSMDGVDYNLTGLRILPMSHEWDFEGGLQGWSLNSGGGWAHGYDSTLGSSNGVYSGSSAIYTYNGNYPNRMSTTYWATSPTIDCSSCSGSWDLKFWKRLGVESSSYDRAYVSVKSSSGWVNVYSNPRSSINDASFTQSTYDISSYVSGNSAFQVRFGLGSTDSSVTYTGWNVDDVVIEPRGNTGSGMANWTSSPFGPNGSGVMQMQHGLMSIDATIPQGSMMTWSLIDSTDGTVIPGFVDLQELSADLSIIDVKKHPLVQLKIQMETNAETPVIHSIKLGGGIIESFNTAPLVGWSGFTSQSNGVVTGSGILSSPEWRFATPFSALEINFDVSGTGNFEACFNHLSDCSSQWTVLEKNRKFTLLQPSSTLNLRWNGNGAYSVNHVEVDLHRQSSPANARIDIGLDGVNEWSFSNDIVSTWGLQDRFDDGSRAKELTIPSGGYDVAGLMYPIKSGILDSSYESKGNLMMSFTAIGFPLDSVEATFSVDGNELFTESLGFIMNTHTLTLSDSQMQDLITEFDSRTEDSTVVGDLVAHKIEVSVSSNSGGSLLLSGLSIPYRYDVHLKDEHIQPIIDSMNSQLSTITSNGGVKEVKIPILMDNLGAVRIMDYGIQTLGSPTPIGITMSNQTETLAAGNDWYEFNSSFDLSVLGVSDAMQHFNDESWSSKFTFTGSKWSRSIECSITTETCNSQQGLILGDFSFEFSGSSVEFYHRVQISSIWPDEEALIVKSTIDMNGPSSEPNEIRFGLGNSMAVEQDIEVVDWHLSFMNGAESTWDALYFDPSNPGVVEVELSFAGIDATPRSSSFNVALYVDGMLTDTTQELFDGVATLLFSPDSSATKVDISIGVSGLYGQSVDWLVPKNAVFLIDETAPTLISTNIAPLDHRSSELPLNLEFVIADRPLLPRHSLLHVETSWDGERTIQLEQPDNLNGFQGIYSAIIDVNSATIGDTMSGWLEVFDPAGHALPESGSEENPLFIVSFGPDGAPVIQRDGLGWKNPALWFHPGENYSIQIPVIDSNGYGDIESISIDLSSNTNENLVIEWNSQSGCNSMVESLIVVECSILGETHHFDPFFTLEVVVSYAWNFNPDSSLERNVQITASDDSGQSSRVNLDSVWRYSSEIEIDLESVSFVNSTEFVSPAEVSELTFDVVWTKSREVVHTTIDVSAYVDEQYQFGLSDGGIGKIEITAPNQTGIYPITLDLDNLPIGVIDRTDSNEIVSWIIVDSNRPKALQLVSPDPAERVQERDWQDLEFEVIINETEGLNLDSLRMHWLILPAGMLIPELALIEGNTTMQLIAGTGSGPSIPLSAIIDVESLIPEVSRQNAWDMWIWVEGEDLAGQEFDSLFNNRASPLAILQLANRDAELRIESSEILLQAEYPVIESPIMVNVTVHNDGQVDGLTSVRVEVVEDGEDRRLIEIISLEVPANSSVSIEVKWIPEQQGAAWVEISTPNGIFERTNPIQIGSDDTSYVIESLDGASSGMLTGFAVITFLMIGLLGYLIMSGRQPRNQDFDESEFI